MSLPGHENECFFISPIGDEGGAIRERADGVRDYIVKPAVADLDLGIEVVRADDIAKPGHITLDVIDHVLNAKVAVADLTGLNPNVFYELAARHAAQLPVVLIAHEEQIKNLPFDIQQMRTIAYDDSSLKKASDAKVAITNHLKAGIEGAVDSPIASAVNLEALRAGNSGEKALAQIVSRMDELSSGQRRLVMEIRELGLFGPDDRYTYDKRRFLRPGRLMHEVVNTPNGDAEVIVEQTKKGAQVRASRDGTGVTFTADPEEMPIARMVTTAIDLLDEEDNVRVVRDADD